MLTTVVGAAWCAVGIGPCADPGTADIGQPVVFRVGQMVRYRDSDLELRFRRVASDSRCPEGAQCVQAGEAVVTFDGRIMKGTPEPFDVPFPAGVAPGGTLPDREYDGYWIRVERLVPVPKVGSTIDSTAYVATVRVGRR